MTRELKLYITSLPCLSLSLQESIPRKWISQAEKMKLLIFFICCAFLVSVRGFMQTCERDYMKIGCFRARNDDKPLVNERFRIQWGNIEKFLTHLACVCAKAARAANKGRTGDDVYHGFALHFWGVCYGKTKRQMDNLLHSSKDNTCIGGQDYNGCREEHKHCVGGAWIDYVYKLREAEEEASLDGGFSEWASWAACTGECGEGVTLRERTCTNPEPKGKGKDCSALGPYTENKGCDTGVKCPVNGGLSSWTEFGACSKTCGGGKQTRTRTCDSPAPAHGGKDCEGELVEEKPCKNDLCPGSDGVSKAQDLVRDFLLGFHNTSYPSKAPSGKFHQAIFAIQKAVANEFALGSSKENLAQRLNDLNEFLKVATAGGSIDFARATLGKSLYVFMKKKIEEGLPIDKLNEASNGYLDSIKREIGEKKFGELMLIDGEATLMFTIDTTGSMRDEINAAKGIANSIINMERKFPVDYILSPFNDPAVGPITHKVESNKAEFVNAIQGLRVAGGGDCPEMAFGGMILAFEENPKLGSPMFVFTDASAKDETFEKKEELKTLADQYGSSINFFTNYRGCGGSQGIKSYQEIAAYTSGQIFPLQSHSEISKFTSYVKTSLKGGTTVAKNKYTSSKKRSVASEGIFFLDEGIETLLITLNVKTQNTAQNVNLKDATGKTYTAQSTTAYSQVYNIDNPPAGQWQLTFPSNAGERSFIAKAIAKNAIDFVPYFLHQESKDSPALSVAHPLQGKASLMLQVSGNERVVHSSLTVDITNEDGVVLDSGKTLKNVGGSAGIFQTDIDTPSQKFKIVLRGNTKNGNKFQRVSQSSFEALDTIMTTISAGKEFTASASQGTAKIKLYLYNKGSTQSYSFRTVANHGSISADVGSMSVPSGKNSTASFTYRLPSNAHSLIGKTTTIAITATGSAGKKVQSAFSMLFVA